MSRTTTKTARLGSGIRYEIQQTWGNSKAAFDKLHLQGRVSLDLFYASLRGELLDPGVVDIIQGQFILTTSRYYSDKEVEESLEKGRKYLEKIIGKKVSQTDYLREIGLKYFSEKDTLRKNW